MIRKFYLTKATESVRLDQFLASQLPEYSRAYLQKLVKSGTVKLDGNVFSLNKTLLPGKGIITVELPEIQSNNEPVAEYFAFDLLYEDSVMAIINKPAGVVVHPAPGNPDGTVVNALLSRYPELRSAELPDGSRPGIVHRLDKDTSGCLAVARTPEAQAKLCEAFAARETGKIYLALTAGVPMQKTGRIENLIGRHVVNRQKMAVVERNGKIAISEYEVMAEGRINNIKTALVKVRIYTGRTHQIRVHLASLGCPVLGDELYGGSRVCPGIPRQMLHAWKLKLPHPVTGEIIKVQAPIPEDIECFYKLMKSGL
ncbi:MAG: RluA family pseudouridine synthase [Lentisphaerae bacterium]|nr:RluA family pseudouridine synthase [Lentisphaerota bacterium]